MKKKFRSRYLFIFLFFFTAQFLFFNIQRGDTYVNFGFSYAISRGEIPYLDFNLVIPPLAPYLYSIFLLVSKSIFAFYLEQAFLLTVMFYFLFQLFGKKAWIYFTLLSISYPISMSSIIFPGYNFLLLFFLVILFYLEKEKKSDLFIGILLGCCFLTKQTVGGLLFLASIYYLFVDYRKFLIRILGFLFSIAFFLCLFLVQGNFWEFLNLCFFGLFDFKNSNLAFDWFYVLLFFVAFLILIIRIIKKPKDIKNYYVLLFSSCVYPIVDYYHVSLFLGAFFLLILEDIHIKRDISIYCIIFSLALGIIWFGVEKFSISNMRFISYPNFPYTMVSESYDYRFQKLENYIQKLDDPVIFLLRSSENYFYKIKNNLDITYFDLPNYGNYGYDGIEEIIDRIKKELGSYFVVDRSAYLSKSTTQQYIKEVFSYIAKNSTLVKKIDYYEIYHYEK